MTVEDPVEYQLPGINQVQVNAKIELTFARALRAFLRQNPDIIMVGEIRDKETAEIAINASLTGHLVLSTLHTNDAAGATTRLIDMGVEPFLVASSAPRHHRPAPHPQGLHEVPRSRTCRPTSRCTSSGSRSSRRARTIYKAVGCPSCSQSGYSGRTVIHELLVIDDQIKRAHHQERRRRHDQESRPIDARHDHACARTGVQQGARSGVDHGRRADARDARGGMRRIMAPIYDYKAFSPDGKASKGHGRGRQPENRARQAQETGPHGHRRSPRKPRASPATAAQMPFFGGRVSVRDIALMTRQLASLVKANIPLVEALNALVDQTENEKLKVMLSPGPPGRERRLVARQGDGQASQGLRQHLRQHDRSRRELGHAWAWSAPAGRPQGSADAPARQSHQRA